VVALDPRTGAVLALADFPSYDPNPLASHNQRTVRDAWNALNSDPNRPLLPRSYRERYFPGSSFKVVTAATGLATGTVTVTQPVYPTITQLPLPQSTQPLRNFGGESCGGPLPEALRVSCNTSFAQLGLDLGGDRLSNGAGAFGFNRVPPLDLPFGAASGFPEASAFARDKPALAKSAIGQQDVSATPLQMALVSAGIANDGVIMTPHLMAEVRDSEGRLVERYDPKPWLTAVPADVAHTVRDMMIGVVENGTGTAARIRGVPVAGKTGTAQTGRDTSHVWFTAFAPADNPRVAVAVVLEDKPNVSEATGGTLAAPIAQTVLRAALGA
jgi:peptidoglycan glycosyltransferase